MAKANSLGVATTGVQFYDGTATYSGITGTTGQVLQANTGVAATYSTATYPSTTTINQLLYSSSANTISGIASANNGILITSGAGVPSVSSTLPTAVQGNITSLGTIASGVWNGTLVTGQFGGTGVANTSKTITLGGSLTTSGAFDSTFTMTGATSVTFPTSGTLATTAGTVASIAGTANQVIASAPTGAVTLSLPQSIATSSIVQFGKLGLGVVASNNELSITGKTSIGFGDTSAPTSGLIVSGNVGIGTSSVTETLDVKGNILLERISDATSGRLFIQGGGLGSSSIDINPTSDNAQIAFHNNNGEGGAANKFLRVSTGALEIVNAAYSSVLFRCLDNGNIGIGVIPVNRLDVNASMVIGVSYAGVNTAPTNGLLCQGRAAFGATSVGTADYLFSRGGAANTLRIESTTSIDDAAPGDAILSLASTADWSLHSDVGTSFLTIYSASTPYLYLNTTGQMGLNTTPQNRLDVLEDGSGGCRIQATNDFTGSGGGSYLSLRKARGTSGARTTVVNGDALGQIVFYGYDGTNFINSAAILSSVDNVVGTNDMPGNLIFYTTPNDTAALSEVMRMRNNGNISVGAATNTYRFQVTGGEVACMTLGNGFRVAEGSNARMGTATLDGGSTATVVVSTTAVTANSRIFITGQTLGTITVGAGYSVSARTAGTSFTITSSATLDTSTVAWIIFEPS